MTNIYRTLIVSTGCVAALTFASPASAQQGYPYPNQNPSGGVIGAIINSVTGSYGQYPQGNYGYAQASQRASVNMCAAAAEQRISGAYRTQPGYGYNNGYGNNGYPQGYVNNGYENNGYANSYNAQSGHVLGITNVERRHNGSLRVTGVATSGRDMNHNNRGYDNRGYGAPNGYPNDLAADLRFTCKVNARGQVSDLNVMRNQVAYRAR
jgi:hypothetical protein